VHDLRCENGIKFGTILDDGTLEVSCRSARCGKAPGIIVLHRISLTTGEIVTTKKVRDFATRRKARQ